MKIVNLVERLFIRPGSTGDDHHRRLYLAAIILLFVPMGATMAWIDFRAGRMAETLTAFGLLGPLLISLAFLRFLEDIRWGYRMVALSSIATLTALLVLVGGEGYAFVWYFFFPAGLFYVFGSREGMLWFVASLVSAGVVVIGHEEPGFPPAMQVRFLVAYTILGALAFGLQRSRDRLLGELQEEKKQLEAALGEVRQLSEMIPMCSWCGDVRDDAGFWSRIEEYLSAQTGTKVSHGLCPKCESSMVDGEVRAARGSRIGRRRATDR